MHVKPHAFVGPILQSKRPFSCPDLFPPSETDSGIRVARDLIGPTANPKSGQDSNPERPTHIQTGTYMYVCMYVCVYMYTYTYRDT